MLAPESERRDGPTTDVLELPYPAAANSELGNRIRTAIDDMPESMRNAVVLRDMQGLSNNEAANVTGVSVGALKARVFRGRRAVRRTLAGRGKQADGRKAGRLVANELNYEHAQHVLRM